MALVPDEPRHLVVLGFGSMAEAADAVPGLLALSVGGARLVACEGLDSRIVDLVRARGGGVPELPRGSGWLFVEVAGEEAEPLVAAVSATEAIGRAAGRRPGRGGGAVADPRGRRRAGGAQPGQPRLLRLGGRGGAARAPRGVAARLRLAALRPRALGGALRPLRRRLRARPDRLRLRRRGRAVPRLPDRERAPAGRLRRLAVRRARRRAGPLGAAAADVRRAVAGPVRSREGCLRPRGTAQPGRPHRPGGRRRRPPACPPGRVGERRAAAHPRRRLPRRRGPPLHRRRALRGPVDQRGDVPVVPRDAGGEGLHPRPGAGAPGGPRRHPGGRPVRSRGARGAGPLPVMQGLCLRLPDRRGHGGLQGRGAAPDLRAPPSAAQPLHAGPAAPSGSGWGHRWRG